MQRTANKFSVLQAIAAIAGFAILLWSVGLPSLRFAEAASVTSFSDTLSTSEPSVVSNHTIQFTTNAGVAAGQSIVISFESGFTGVAGIAFGDVDLSVDTGSVVEEDLAAAASGADWGVSSAGQDVTITSGTDTIGANATVTIEIGTNATTGVTGTNQITNPAAGSYEVTLTSGATDTGSTRVATIETVLVTASVDTLFTFTVGGVIGGQTVNGTTTTGSTTPTTIPFGVLDAGVASTAAQDLTVVTNARNGFVVTVTADGQLDSSTGADIDGFRNGNFDSTAVPWESPSASVADENTWGHWGITSDDPTITAGLTDEFDTAGDGQDYVSASTTPVEVFRHDGPIDGTLTGQGTARIGYTVEISALQEAGNDYDAILTYVATPVF